MALTRSTSCAAPGLIPAQPHTTHNVTAISRIFTSCLDGIALTSPAYFWR